MKCTNLADLSLDYERKGKEAWERAEEGHTVILTNIPMSTKLTHPLTQNKQDWVLPSMSRHMIMT
jgi:hypothetical protein